MADLRERLLRLSVPGEGGCRVWAGARFPNGYGKVTVGSQTDGTRRVVGAHRVAYETFVGAIPAGLDVLHSCDNRPCIAPEHLFVGTDVDNARDRDVKGRDDFCPGERNGQAKLTAEAVVAMRLMVAYGVTQGVLADWFGVSFQAVSKIVTGKRWAHVPEVQ